jgi:hypothetical protein
MKLTRALWFYVFAIAMVGVFGGTEIQAKLDAPLECVTEDGVRATVVVEPTNEQTTFSYTVDATDAIAGKKTLDHSVLVMDCVEECTGPEDTDCWTAFGGDAQGSDIKACGEGDPILDVGALEKSEATFVANPRGDVFDFFITVRGPQGCSTHDIVTKVGSAVSSCVICSPMEVLHEPGFFSNTVKDTTIDNCTFRREFHPLTLRMVSQQVLPNPPGEPPCEGIVLSQDPDTGNLICSASPGNLLAQCDGTTGPLPPLPFGEFNVQVSDAAAPGGLSDFGFGQQEEPGGIEFSSGDGTCVVLTDGIGGTSLSCTCRKPFSKGEIKFCGK